jgi:hypothetical protein
MKHCTQSPSLCRLRIAVEREKREEKVVVVVVVVVVDDDID